MSFNFNPDQATSLQKAPDGTATAVYEWTFRRMIELGVRVNAAGTVQGSMDTRSVVNHLTMMNTDLPKTSRFPMDAVKAACAEALVTMRKDRLAELKSEIDGSEPFDPDVHSKLVSLMSLAAQGASFSAEESALLIEKTIWQVKRKLFDLPVTNHTMLVFVGPQGAGKSEMVKAMTKPVREITVNTTFGELTDERNIGLFDNYVGFADELQKAKRADIETLRNVITSQYMSRRVMNTNMTSTFKQNLTFIGASNKGVVEVVIDDTGYRRFVQIDIVGPKHPNSAAFWQGVSTFDWLSLWRSISHQQGDPAGSIKARVDEVQKDAQGGNIIQRWIEDLIDIHDVFVTSNITVHRLVVLYEHFRDWEHQYGSTTKTPRTEFENAFRRMAQQLEIPFAEHRNKKARGFRYTGPITARPIDRLRGAMER